MPFVPLPGATRERALAKLLPQNGVLAALPEDVRARLLPHLALADLPAGQQLGQPSGNFARAYFPVAGVVALVQGSPDGGERVSALVGSEGVVGLPKFMSDASVTRVVVQSAGYGLALGREQLLEEWARGGTFMRLLMRYNRALAAQKVVLNACRGLHSLDQQLGTLLLMCLDRLSGQEAVLPQDSVARLLGASPQELGAAVDRRRAAGVASWRPPRGVAGPGRAPPPRGAPPCAWRPARASTGWPASTSGCWSTGSSRPRPAARRPTWAGG